MKLASRVAVAAALAAAFVSAGAESLQEKLTGTWLVESVVQEENGKRAEPFGPKPLGMFMFTADGHFSTQIVNPNRIKFSANNRAKGTPEENTVAMTGTTTTFGTYKIDDKGLVRVHIIGSNYPNWDNTDQVRQFVFDGDTATYTNPTAGLGGTATIKLKKVR